MARSVVNRVSQDGRVLIGAIAAVQMLLSYEFLVSGVNKLTNPNFTIQFGSRLRQGFGDSPYSWYTVFFRGLVVSHPTVIALLVELGELSVGAALLISAGLRLWTVYARVTAPSGRVASAVLIGVVFMWLNYVLRGESLLPFLSSADVFREGFDLDVLISALCIGLFVATLFAVRTFTWRPDIEIHSSGWRHILHTA